MRYYNLRRYWHKVEPHTKVAEVQQLLVRDFRKFTMGRWGQQFLPGMVPREFESCDWDWEHRGPEPEFWKYTKHSACHWIVNFTLELAQLTLPKRKWRIISSQEHSTVWDGKLTLFDFNFQAFGIPANEAYALAVRNGRELPVGKRLRIYWAENAFEESKRLQQKSDT